MNPFSLSSLLPKIFLLPFSKALAYPKQKLARLLLFIMYVLFLAIVIFINVQFYEAETTSDLIFSASITGSLTVLFLFFANHCFHAFLTVGKDWDKAKKELNIWAKIFKSQGKTRYILRTSIYHFVLMSVLVLLQARRSIRLGAMVSTLVIGALFVIGIILASELVLWQLNIKYEEKIEAQLWQVRGSSEEHESIVSNNT